MSNNVLVISLVAVMLLGWSIYLSTERTNKWTFPLWFPFTATSGLGTIYWLYAIAAMCDYAGALGVVWAVFCASFAFLPLLSAPIFLTISLRCRPRPTAYSPAIVSATVVAYLALVAGVVAAPSKLDRLSVHLHLVTIDEQPVANARVSYRTFTHEEGYSPSIETEAITDAAGHAVIFTRRRHWVHGFIKKDGYSKTDFQFYPAYGFGHHQTQISWQGAAAHTTATSDYQDNQNATINVPAAKEPVLKLYLPRKGIDTWLPYPPYDPTPPK